jgi:aminopeptidase C
MLKDHHVGLDVLNGHAVSLVGRRFNPVTQSCEYLLRNSWGKKCTDTYSSNYECKDGHIWIDEAYFQFNRSIRRAVYLEKK